MVKTSIPVEDTARGLFAELMNQIIKEENLPFERVDVQWEIKSPSATTSIRKGQRDKRWFADIIIWEKFLVKPASYHLRRLEPSAILQDLVVGLIQLEEL